MHTKVGNQPGLRIQEGIFPREYRRKSPEEKNIEIDEKRRKKKEMYDRITYLIRTDDIDRLDEEYPGFRYSPIGKNMVAALTKQRRTEYVKTFDGRIVKATIDLRRTNYM